MVENGDIPHMLFYGPSGAGKKTRIMALLREIYGAGVEKVKVAQKEFKRKMGSGSTKKIEVTTLQSNYHIEMNASEAGNNDQFIIQAVIKEIAQTSTLDPNTQKSYKVVVLNEVERLSNNAQNALRRTMEKYMKSCRLILCAESSCRVISPLRSRCLSIRVPAPTYNQVFKVLLSVAQREKISLPEALARRVAVASDRNLRRAILMLEACKADHFPFSEKQQVALSDWEVFIQILAKSVTQQQSPQRLLVARAKVYELLTNCIPPDVIIRTLVRYLMAKTDDTLKHRIIKWAAFYEHRMKCSSKPIFHIEAFLAKFMSEYKNWVIAEMEM